MKAEKAPLKVLSIAGSDPSSGAGIQADLKTFHNLGVYGLSVITSITAQNTRGVWKVYPLTVNIVVEQIKTLVEDIKIDSVKIGMLGSGEIAKAVAGQLRKYKLSKIVIDPIISSHTGQSLIDPQGIDILINELIPIADVLTPNLNEASIITGEKVSNLGEMKEAAQKMYELGADNIFLKGGHAKNHATDVFFDGRGFLIMAGKKVKGKSVHGTGCTISSALAVGLALQKPVPQAVIEAKEYVRYAFREAIIVGGGRRVANQELIEN